MENTRAAELRIYLRQRVDDEKHYINDFSCLCKVVNIYHIILMIETMTNWFLPFIINKRFSALHKFVSLIFLWCALEFTFPSVFSCVYMHKYGLVWTYECFIRVLHVTRALLYYIYIILQCMSWSMKIITLFILFCFGFYLFLFLLRVSIIYLWNDTFFAL